MSRCSYCCRHASRPRRNRWVVFVQRNDIGGGGMFSRLSLWKWVLAAGVGIVTGYYLIPGDPLKDLAYSAVGAGATVAIVIGVRLHRPTAARGWYLVASANLCFVLGDIVLNLYDGLWHTEPPFPSADVVYLAGYPLLFTGLVRIMRPHGMAGSRDGLLDAAIVSVGALGLTWHFLMGPTLHATALSAGSRGGAGFSPAKLVTMLYPAMDLGILTVVVAAVLLGSARRAADQLLLAAVVLILIADFWYDLDTLHGSYGAGSAVNAAFLLNYVLMGAAALHPSVGTTHSAAGTTVGGDPAMAHSERRWWVPLVAGAALISPVIMLVNGIAGLPVDLPVLAGTCLLVFVLVSLRVYWLFGRVTRQNALLQHRSQSLRWALAAQEMLEDDLQHQAFHDSLTGLPNRALLQDRLEQALRTAQLHQPVALCFCDLDNFKGVNDTLGHPIGDELLVVVAKRLTSVVRGLATVARLGGDEFAVLLEDADQLGAANALAERIVSVLREPIRIAEHRIVLSASVGVVLAGPDTTTEQMMSEADAAMYEAKATGKDRVAVFETCMRSRMVERMAMVNGFQGGLSRSEFFLEYQPQFSLADNRLTGFEALVRWQHPTLGLIGPGRFVAVAEETKFILPLGSWILAAACREAARWPAVDDVGLTVAVNLSGWQLQDRQLLPTVLDALRSSGLPGERLVLEVTESVLLADTTQTAQVLRELRGFGIRVAIDDFGTGYSSLSQLRQLPVDILKIDKSFIDPLFDPTNQGDAFVSTIVRLARELKLSTVAEGIEHPIQRATLIRLGCQDGQGYLMSVPLGAQRAIEFIARNSAELELRRLETNEVDTADPRVALPYRASRAGMA